jgi:hypothetical protein
MGIKKLAGDSQAPESLARSEGPGLGTFHIREAASLATFPLTLGGQDSRGIVDWWVKKCS